MSAKCFFVFCAQALFIQLALSQCAGRTNIGAGQASYGRSYPIASGIGASACAGSAIAAPVFAAPTCSAGYNGLGYGNAGLGYDNGFGYGSNLAIEVIPTSGGSLSVSSTSTVAPTGLSITSDNVIEGSLYVVGELPFLSAVALEGVLPSGGAGVASYSLGNGVTAIESITPAAGSIAPGAGYGTGPGVYGPGAAAIAPLSGCSGAYAPAIAPVAGIVAPECGCYPDGIYY